MTKYEEILNKHHQLWIKQLEESTDENIFYEEWINNAMKEYAKFCCEEQKKICEDKLRDWDTENTPNVCIPFDIILNAPTYKEEDESK